MKLKKKELFHIASPIMASIYSFIFYLFSIMIPPNVYTFYMNEPDLMFMDFRSILYVFLCTISFILGAVFLSLIPPIRLKLKKLKKIVIPQKMYYSFPLIFVMFIVVFLLLFLIKKNLSILPFIFVGQGNIIKESLFTPPLFFPFLYVFIGIFFWFYNNYLRINRSLFLKYLVYLSVFIVFVASFLMVARFLLMPFLLSMILIYIFSLEKINFSFILKTILIILFFFSLFTLIRGGDVIYNIIGYGPASYNRLSAVLSGDIKFQEKFYYLSTFFNPDVRVIDVLRDEHKAISAAGLDYKLNWISVYGYIFIALNWFALIYFFFLGVFMQFCWKLFINNTVIGRIIYPWFFTLILLWFSFNMFSWATTIIFILTAILMFLYEMLFCPSYKTNFIISRRRKHSCYQ